MSTGWHSVCYWQRRGSNVCLCHSTAQCDMSTGWQSVCYWQRRGSNATSKGKKNIKRGVKSHYLDKECTYRMKMNSACVQLCVLPNGTNLVTLYCHVAFHFRLTITSLLFVSVVIMCVCVSSRHVDKTKTKVFN